jgi:hypothetical protein
MSDADHPVEQMQRMIADARQTFASDVDGLLAELFLFSRTLGDAVGEITREEALRALRRFILEKFDQRLPMRSTLDPVLQQLVREAYDVLSNPKSQIDVKDWIRTAEPFVRT